METNVFEAHSYPQEGAFRLTRAEKTIVREPPPLNTYG